MAVVNHLDYNSFGQLLSQTNPATGNAAAIDCLFGFTGLPFDNASGTYRTPARPYDPSTGRWIEPDPTEFTAGDTNLYGYCDNSPTDATDPTGLVIGAAGHTLTPDELAAQKALDFAILQVGVVGHEIQGQLLEIADKLKNAKPGEQVDLSSEIAKIKEYSSLYVQHLTEAYVQAKKTKFPTYAAEQLAKIGGVIDGLNVFVLAGSDALNGLQAAVRATQVAIDGQIRGLDRAITALQTAQTINNIAGLLVGGWQVGVKAVATKSIVKGTVYVADTLIALGGTYVLFQVGKDAARSMGASEQTISYLDAAVNIAPVMVLLNSGCFVAGTPVLVPQEPAGEASSDDDNEKPSEQSADRDRLLAGAALLVGLTGLKEERRKKAKKKGQVAGLPPWLVGDDAPDDESLYENAMDECLCDDGVREIHLVRSVACDDETLRAIGFSRSDLDKASRSDLSAAAISEEAAIAAPPEATSSCELAPLARPGVKKPVGGRSGRLRRSLYLAAFLVAALLGGKSLLALHGTGARSSKATATASARPSQGIETIRVGQRVLSHNPDSRGAERIGETAVNPATWRHLSLRAVVHGGNYEDHVEVETLQPPEWVEAHHAFRGATVPLPLDLAEMGLPTELRAEVVANESCPSIQGGEGRVVLTTVSHMSHCVGRLTVQDEKGRCESIRPTASHKFYREPAGEWVSLHELQPGDRLRGASGALRVVAVSGERGIERVYNMTVEGEHVYYVSVLECWHITTAQSPFRAKMLWSGPRGRTTLHLRRLRVLHITPMLLTLVCDRRIERIQRELAVRVPDSTPPRHPNLPMRPAFTAAQFGVI